MSYIFSGLRRKNNQISDNFELISYNEKFKPKVPFNEAVQCFTIKLNDKKANALEADFKDDDDWEENPLLLYTNDESFLKNDTKLKFLNEIEGHLPKIFFFFRPIYATQLAIRYATMQISGTKDNKQINHIIGSNNEILGYFLKFYELCKEVYTGAWLTKLETYNNNFNNGLILALLELRNLLRNDSAELIRLAPSRLKQWGDNSNIISGLDINDEKMAISRKEIFDIDMNTIDKVCITCGQHFASVENLLEHISSHDTFICNICRIQVNEYSELATHHLTFCRSTVWNNSCIYCKNTKEECKCTKNLRLILDTVHDFSGSKENSIIYASDMISTINHYYNTKDTLITNKSAKEVLVDLIKDVDRETPLKLEISREEGINKINELLPDILVNKGNIISSKLQITENWNRLKKVLESHFTSYQEVELHIIKCVEELRTKCLYKDCTGLCNQKHHIEKHGLCPCAKSLTSEEIPIRFKSAQKMYSHCLEHNIYYFKHHIAFKVYCAICDKLMSTEQGLNIGAFFNHLETHLADQNWDEQICCKNKKLEVCKGSIFKSPIEEFFHKIIWHVNTEMDLEAHIRDMSYEGNTIADEPKRIKTLKSAKHLSVKRALTFDDLDESSSSSDETVQDKNKQKMIDVKQQQYFSCENEKHTKPKIFDSKIALKKHVIENHSCSYKGCMYSNMFEKNLLTHYEIHIENSIDERCDICKRIVKDLKGHLNEHPKCRSCQVQFENLADLRLHEPSCAKISKQTVETLKNTASLNVDTTELESKFANIMQKLLKDSNLEESEKTVGAQIIEKYTSSNTIAKNRTRIDAINNRRNDALLFDIPNFTHADKPQLHKVLSSIGDIKSEEKFNPSIQNSNQNCVLNFESFELLLKKIDSLVLLGNLTEALTVALLQRFIGQAVIDAVSSYQQKAWEDLSFQSILESIQWIYIPLKLNIFQTIVLSYTHDKNTESFLEFASKVYRHLKLCARLKSKEERPEYIEQNSRKILKRNLPVKLLDAIESKESLYTPFTSKEIIDHFVSYVHNQTEGRADYSKYNVFALKIKNQPATIRSKPRKRQPKFASKTDKTQRVKKYTKGATKVDSKTVREVKGDKKPKREPSEASKVKLEKLKEFGIDTTYPLCFLCLRKHSKYKCKQYQGVGISEDLCIIRENNKPKPMGYHKECRHGDKRKEKTNVKVWKPRNH